MMPLVSGLCAIIPGGISVEDYAIATSTDHVSAKSMLLDLVENQIGVQEKQSFEYGDRLRAAILCFSCTPIWFSTRSSSIDFALTWSVLVAIA